MEQKKRFKKAVRCFASSSWARPGQAIHESELILNGVKYEDTDLYHYTRESAKRAIQEKKKGHEARVRILKEQIKNSESVGDFTKAAFYKSELSRLTKK